MCVFLFYVCITIQWIRNDWELHKRRIWNFIVFILYAVYHTFFCPFEQVQKYIVGKKSNK